ncbi:MAG TPA: cyclic nucleotide-binding domain-containing protein [Bradyrhizobium sp.]|nr:cyclic nucleotide-binding domain-containing protein [Bradyrhizobium sp.]
MSKPNGDDRHRHDLLQTILKGHFASDDAELIASIKAAAEFIDLPSGDVLFHQGEHSDDVYFVLSGRLLALAEANGESKIPAKSAAAKPSVSLPCSPANHAPLPSSPCAIHRSSK